MLLIVMHKDRKFLDTLMGILRNDAILDATIIEKKWIGKSLLGDNLDSFYSRGQLKSDFDKAIISAVSDETKLKQIIEKIFTETDIPEHEIFLCTVPFAWIKDLQLESTKAKPRNREIMVSNCLTVDQINLDLKSSTKEDAIRELAESLKSHPALTDYEAFLQGVFEREKVGTTGIGNGIAIPHARTDAVNQFIIAFGRSQKGIPFGAPDGQPAKLIFLMGAVKTQVNNYLKILARLTRLLRKESFRERLMNAETREAVIKAFQEIEGISD